ncbi:serine hydrolase domain-containing protein [Lichenicoccus sp.]|uniref:serine hydrolase domain-containing protein n=1 Tax=Lichenicoccus sp. TaxID=2781899 RepID=UPI003D0FEC0F
MPDLRANITNWRTAPHNRWAFRNVDRVVSCATIAHDRTHVRPLPRASGKLRSILTSAPFLRYTSTDAMVVMRAGLLVGIIEARGELDVAAPISRYVPEIAESPYGIATIRDLIDMRLGVKLTGTSLAAYEEATNWVPADPGRPDPSLRAFFSGLAGIEVPQASPFSYVSANTDLLGWVLERATGETIAALVSAHLWQPMGAEADAAITVDREGLARCAGGLCATVRDLARIGQLMINGGAVGSTQVVPGPWVEDIWQNGDPQAWRTGEWGKVFAPISQNMRYRSNWYVIDDHPETLFAMGIHGQNLFVDRVNQLVVAKLSHWPKPTMSLPTWLTHKAFGRLQRK